MDAGHDPWEHVEDLDGTEHYRVLELDFSCSDEDVRAAYRRLARVHHPDKGGSPNRFQRLRRAYEVLGDSSSRKAYDMHAGQLKYRYIPGVRELFFYFFFGGGAAISTRTLIKRRSSPKLQSNSHYPDLIALCFRRASL